MYKTIFEDQKMRRNLHFTLSINNRESCRANCSVDSGGTDTEVNAMSCAG